MGVQAVELVRTKKAADSAALSRAEDHTTDIVPLSERRSPVTMGLLWITMVTGFPTVLVGFEWWKAGVTLPQVLQGIAISCLVLIAYGMLSTLMGARSGQTYSLLSRNVFGTWGSKFVSLNLALVNLAWYGLTANFLADGLRGLYHLDVPTAVLGAFFAVLMAFNNFFGFSGIANFARYLAAPVLIAWVGYTFYLALQACPSTVISAQPTVPFTQSLTLVSTFVIGYAVWGNEADFWRFSKQRKELLALPLTVALLIGQVLFPVTGWMLAYLTGASDAAGATDVMNRYAFGGLSIISAVVLAVTYFAVNDSGLYGAINGLENLKAMPRKLAVFLLATVGTISAIALAGNEHAFELVATVSSIALPSVTAILITEYFYFSKRPGRRLDFSRVPDWSELPPLRWRAVTALVCAFVVGLLTSGLLPGLGFMRFGVCSLQAWLTAFLVYSTLRLLERPLIEERRALLEALVQTTETATPPTAVWREID